MDEYSRDLDPDSLRLLEDAWSAFEDGDHKAARETLVELAPAAAEVPAVLELVAELALADDEPEAALEAYGRWSAADPGDPEPWIATAEVYLQYYDDPGEAARLLRELLAGPQLDPLDEADARHLLGIACEEKNDRRGMIKEWLAVLRLDAMNDGPEPMLSARRFEDIADEALGELPEEVLTHLRNVPIFVEDRPSEALVLEGLDPRTLGLFHGIAMPHQSALGGGPENSLIHLFQRNLEREAVDEDELAEQIRITVLHETAHYFGATEEDLKRYGLN